MQLTWPILSVLMWLPILGGVALLVLGDRGISAGRWVALITTVVTFGLSTLLWTNFDMTTADMQFVEKLTWIPAFNAWYALGVDGIAMPLIILTTFVTPLVVIAGWTVIEKRPAQYFA